MGILADKKKLKNHLLDFAVFLAGTAIFSAAVNVFTAPNNIAPGGVTGISTMIRHVSGFPIGLASIIINIPLFIFGAKQLGRSFLTKTVIATVMLSVLIDTTSTIVPPYQGDPLLAAIYGGVIQGVGLGLVFLRGGTTGGTDIAARLINRRFPQITMGRFILYMDMVVIGASAIVFQSVDSALYSLIAIFASTSIIDQIIYGVDMGKLVYIISYKYTEIAQKILKEMERGVTLLDGHGAYTGSKKDVIMCVVRRHESFKLRRLVQTIDPDAFIIVGDVGEVAGEGFKSVIVN